MTFKKIHIHLSIVIVTVLALGLLYVMLQDKLHSVNTATGEAMPAFTLETFEPVATDPLTFSDQSLKGQVTFVVFFASWCPGCVAEHPSLALIEGRQGLLRLGVAVQDKDTSLARMLKKKGNPFDRIGSDRDGQVSNIWNLRGVPESFIIDKAGFIRFHHSGALNTSIIQKEILPLIDALIAEGDDGASSQKVPMSDDASAD
ncbi:MAG: redoxin family protein [Candidatus Nucleicultricaceae bacterium]